MPEIHRQQYPPTDTSGNYFAYKCADPLQARCLPASVLAADIDREIEEVSTKDVRLVFLHIIGCNAESMLGVKKRSAIEFQVTKEKAHIFIAQEARQKTSKIRDAGPFISATSAASKGQLGCEILFNKSIPFAFIHVLIY